MDEVLGSQVMPLEKIEALEQYSKYALKAGNIYEHIRGIECMSSAYDMLEDTAMILYTEKRAHDLYIQHGFKAAAASAYVMTMTFYVESGQFHKAAPLMLRFESESGLFDQDGNICKGREHYYYIKGTYYQGVHQLDSAEYYFRRLLTYNNSYVAYRGLMGVKMEKGQADSVIYFAQKRETAFNTFVSNIHAQATRQALGMYNYTRLQRQAFIKNLEVERERLIRWGILAIAITSLTFLVWRYKAYRTKKAAELRRMETASLNLTVQLMKANEELAVMQDSYNELKSHALAQKEREIEVLKAEVKEYQQKIHQISSSEKEMALLESDKVRMFKRMADSYHQMPCPSDADWEQLAALLQQTLPLFHARIASEGKLTTQEMRVAVLTRLNFSPNELAILLEVSSQRITNLKENVNRKLFQDESAKTLYKNLKKV